MTDNIPKTALRSRPWLVFLAAAPLLLSACADDEVGQLGAQSEDPAADSVAVESEIVAADTASRTAAEAIQLALAAGAAELCAGGTTGRQRGTGGRDTRAAVQRRGGSRLRCAPGVAGKGTHRTFRRDPAREPDRLLLRQPELDADGRARRVPQGRRC